jgi:hypothetical protein
VELLRGLRRPTGFAQAGYRHMCRFQTSTVLQLPAFQQMSQPQSKRFNRRCWFFIWSFGFELIWGAFPVSQMKVLVPCQDLEAIFAPSRLWCHFPLWRHNPWDWHSPDFTRVGHHLISPKSQHTMKDRSLWIPSRTEQNFMRPISSSTMMLFRGIRDTYLWHSLAKLLSFS